MSRARTRGGIAVLPLLCACAGPAPDPAAFTAAAWPAADGLFRQDPRWLGGDAAYSVELGGDRRLWLFGDSFIARPGACGRRGAAMARNSIAVQRGPDPETATMEFAWRGAPTGPASWFPEDGPVWHWPLHGVRLGDRVVVFCSRPRPAGEGGPFGFRAIGWTAFSLTAVDDPPDAWRCERLATPAAPFDVVVGHSVVADGDFVHAFAQREPGDHAVFLLRWPRAAFAAGALQDPQWRSGAAWIAHADLRAAPEPVLAVGAPEFSVTDAGAGLVMVQSLGFGATDLAVRTAPALHGPWSEPARVLRPPESDAARPLVYAGKATPLGDRFGGDLLATYAANAWDFGDLVRDEALYWPRCVRIRRRRGGDSARCPVSSRRGRGAVRSTKARRAR